MTTCLPAGDHYHRNPAVRLHGAPWDADTVRPDPRPETAPRRGVVSHRHSLTPQQVVDTIRREWIRTRAGA